MIDSQLPGRNKVWSASFTITNGTLLKIVADVWKPQVDAAITSANPTGVAETAIPGESGVRQRIFTGGQRIIDVSVSSTDGTARSIKPWLGRETSLFADMGTVSTTVTNVLNRSVGSFITDGYKVGDTVMFDGAPTAGNNGAVGILTGVTALTLTANGAPWTNETMGAGFRVFRVSPRTQVAVALNAGNTDAAPAVKIMGNAQDPATLPPPDTGWSLGSSDILAFGMVAAISALPAQVHVQAQAVLY